MTPYERGYAAALKAAADSIKGLGTTYISIPYAADQILSLPIVGEADQRGAAAGGMITVGSILRAASHPIPGEQESLRAVPEMEGSDHKPTSPARPGPSQECVSDLSERLRQYADIADAGGKAHWANAMREAMYTLAVYRQNAAKEEHDAHR